MRKKYFIKIAGFLFCFLIITELIVNYYASFRLFPIKHGNTYGFLEKKTGRVVIPLNKYSSRFLACAALPYELYMLKMFDKKLVKDFNQELNKYGFKDEQGKLRIEYKFDEVKEFEKNYAIAGVIINGVKKYGTIDKKGKWVIKPEYYYICDSKKYYIKACIDKNHCGAMDRFGNKITQMTYDIEHIKCENCDKIAEFCAIGSKNKNMSCNYFL